MPLILQQASIADLPELTDVWDISFANSSALDGPLFPHTAEIRTFFQASYLEDFSDPSAVFLKAIDPENGGRIAAYAKWYIPVPLEPSTTAATTGADSAQQFTVGGATPEDVESIPWPADYDAALCREVFGAFTRARRAIFGNPMRPHYYLERVGVRPENGGKGAARMLIEWGLERADREGLQAFVEAHDGVVRLYERFGWRTADSYRNERIGHVENFMVREPREKEEKDGVGGEGK